MTESKQPKENVEGKGSLDDFTPATQGKILNLVSKKSGLLSQNDDSARVAFYSDEVVMLVRHYKSGVGYRRCTKYLGFCPVCDGAVDPKEATAREAYGLNVFVYDTEPNGEGRPDGLGDLKNNKISGKNYLWILPPTSIAELKKQKRLLGTVLSNDFLITMKKADFSEVTIDAMPEKQSKIGNQKVRDYIQKVLAKGAYDINKMICKTVTIQELAKEFKINPKILNTPAVKKILDNAVPDSASTDEPDVVDAVDTGVEEDITGDDVVGEEPATDSSSSEEEDILDNM